MKGLGFFFFFNLPNVYKRKYGARKLFQNKQRNKKISKCLIIKWNTSGLLLLPPPKKILTKIWGFSLSMLFSLEKLPWGKCFWEVIRGPVKMTGAAVQWVTIERQWAGKFLSLINLCLFLCTQADSGSVMSGKAKFLNIRTDKCRNIPSYL